MFLTKTLYTGDPFTPSPLCILILERRKRELQQKEEEEHRKWHSQLEVQMAKLNVDDNFVKCVEMLLFTGKVLWPFLEEIIFRRSFKVSLEDYKCMTPLTCQRLVGKPELSTGWCKMCVKWSEKATRVLCPTGNIPWTRVNSIVRCRRIEIIEDVEDIENAISDGDAANIMSVVSDAMDRNLISYDVRVEEGIEKVKNCSSVLMTPVDHIHLPHVKWFYSNHVCIYHKVT